MAVYACQAPATDPEVSLRGVCLHCPLVAAASVHGSETLSTECFQRSNGFTRGLSGVLGLPGCVHGRQAAAHFDEHVLLAWAHSAATSVFAC